MLILNVPCISESCIEIKIKLNFYFYTSLWCLKRFYESLKGDKGVIDFLRISILQNISVWLLSINKVSLKDGDSLLVVF